MFESTLLVAFLYACYWAWRQQAYAYRCYVCDKPMRYNSASCSDKCTDLLYADSTPVVYPE